MFRISGINSGSNYKINPQYENYFKIFKKASKEYEDLERIMQNGKVNPSIVEKYVKAKKTMDIAENDCRNVQKYIKDNSLNNTINNKNEKSLHKIDYYC